MLVCDSPFSNLTHLCQELASNNYNIPGCCFNCFWCFVKSKIRKEAKFNIDDLNIIQIIQTLQPDVAIVFLSAKGDTLIGEKHPKILSEKFRGIKELIQFEGTHNSKRPVDVMKGTVQFIIAQMEKYEQHSSLRDTKVSLNCKDQIPIPDIGAPLLHSEKPYISKTEK